MENILLSASGDVRLCDFGSATTKCYYPDADWTMNQRGLVEEEVGNRGGERDSSVINRNVSLSAFI